MNPERARELLEAQVVGDASERRAKRIAGLPRRAREAASQLDAEPWYMLGRAVDGTSAPKLEALSAADRRAAFGALQPKLADQLERMWQDGVGRPYQLDAARRAFRAPHAPNISLANRHQRLCHVLAAVARFEPGAVWVARWAAHLSADYLADSVGVFLAAVVDGAGAEGNAVFDVLVASADGEDDVGAMGRHVTRALLAANRPDGWAFVERLLLAAQRQEGLRQTILETVDEAHPQAFRRILRTIVDNDLVRFPATVRAIDVWFDFAWGAPSGRGLNDVLERVLRFLDDAGMRDAALRSGTAEDTYLALWCLAFDDALAAAPRAAALLADPDPARRFVAVHLLALLGITTAVGTVAPALDDADLRVAARALDAVLAGRNRPVAGAPLDTFERLERLLARLPKASVALEPLVWPWTGRTLQRATVAGGLVTYLGERPPVRLVRYPAAMDTNARVQVALKLAATHRPAPDVRRALLSLAGDASPMVRGLVVEAVKRMETTDDEAFELEALLTRKAADLRRAVVAMLLARGPDPALASANRLLGARNEQQRLAGLEILRRLVEGDTAVDGARERAVAYREATAKPTETERTQLDAILGSTIDRGELPAAPSAEASAGPSAAPEAAEARLSTSRADGFGLLDLASRTPPRAPQARSVAFVSDAAVAVIRSLDDVVHEHRSDPVATDTWTGVEERLLGEITHGFPVPAGGAAPRIALLATLLTPDDVPAAVERSRERLPLHDVWERWWAERGPSLRDDDGLELVRAHFVPFEDPPSRWPKPTEAWIREVDAILGGGRQPLRVRYPHVVASLVTWLAVLHPAPGTASFLLDATEQLIVSVPAGTRLDGDRTGNFGPGWRDDDSPWLVGLRLARALRRMRPDVWSREDHVRQWGLERWVDEAQAPPAGSGSAAVSVRRLVTKLRKGESIELSSPGGEARNVPPLEELVAAFRAGIATDDDVVDQLVGPGSADGWNRSLRALSGRAGPAAGAGDPRLAAVVERIRRRLVDVEARRGEAPTEASPACLSLQYSGGLDALVRLVRALGPEPFVRGYSYDGESRRVVFSRLIRATMPGPDDPPPAFAAAMRSAGVSERRLVEVGCFAPQWAEHVEAAVGWDGLASAIWWMHAHTKDPTWVVAEEVREAWTAQVAERTPLDSKDLLEGAVDVDWFGRVYAQLGPKRWKVLDAAAKYSSTGGGHKRAQLFADAMRGAVTEEQLRPRIDEKRHQDAVRALGLVPLPGEEARGEATARDDVVLARYRTLQEFIRTSRQFGSSRQASEKRAAEIGLANLARTAGYADPIRLGWAMEARGVADLADGPLAASVGDVTVTLGIDSAGEPDFSVARSGVIVKAVPAAVKKDRSVAALRSQATELRRQASRIRRSLETAMVRGDGFSGAELRDLDRHPLIAPHLRRLVLAGDGVCGYPVAGGLALVDAAGREQAVAASELLRLAHPLDLLERGDWTAWQEDVFGREIVQPFKQVFREVYVPTASELAEANGSSRYAGHQVNPRQAIALLGGRGWVIAPEEGVRKTFHDARLSVYLTFLEPFHTPAEIDGLTLERVVFARAGDWQPVPPAEVPPRLFSETMRDLDLVVSVAHAGGVDPEASASTVEMRSLLVAETARLLDLPNVRIDGSRALVDGSLAEYSVHLGSGVVHRRPGGALFIVPVHAQARGRLFLPFADDDPKTAEVLSKVLLLARDAEIRDSALLEQIRGTR